MVLVREVPRTYRRRRGEVVREWASEAVGFGLALLMLLGPAFLVLYGCSL